MDTTRSTAVRSLGRMKALALALLLAAAGVYVLATLMLDRHPVWGYVAAAAEAGMVGALADWFAVVALFRHPLGLPIPHTRILPANQDRLGQRLAEFLDQHFLTRERIDQALARWDVSGALVTWLADPGHRDRVVDWLAGALPDVLAALRRDPVPGWVTMASRRLVHDLDVAVLGGQALQALAERRHHQRWLETALEELAGWVGQERVQEPLTEAIARELARLRYLGLDQLAARLATRKLVAALTRMLGEVVADPDHAWRRRFDAWIRRSARRLQRDPQWRAQAAAWRDAWLAQPRWDETVRIWWDALAERLRAGLRADDGPLREHLHALLRALAEQLAADDGLREALNRQWRQTALAALERARPAIVDFVAARVSAWDAEEMSAVLERHIGRDLQFIRINGTLVGALVGLALHALTQHWLR
jgi:uncharacterized membrane-anchored protein YjiN (DUF445 family)